ncbi:transketolase [Paenibacillus thalictri]|uniref:transketolase n=1 Tax=Paenibacillus thalictri TaxID=2527873 RepID=UPI001F0DB47D|nr:transketolase [Paenibacillus thalictri]
MTQTIDQLAIDTIRTLSIDATNSANSGHPGLPMGAAPMAYALWAKLLNHNPGHAKWFNRDRFVLSAGHGSMLLYSLLHLSGYQVSLDDLKQFRKLNSKTPGHPEFGHTDGVEATTGPLGQGIAMAVGMAMAEAHLAAKFNQNDFPVVDHYTYALVGDGCLMEGISYEAMSMAGHMKLGKLIVLYDSNDISLDGKLGLSFGEQIQKRAESAHWEYLRVEDGNDVAQIVKAIEAAKQNQSQPTLIEVRTIIGYGSKAAGTSKVHGAPLGKEEGKATKQAYGWQYEEEFTVPAEVKAHYAQLKQEGQAKEEAWNRLVASYNEQHPALGQELAQVVDGSVTIDAADILTFDSSKTLSTRVASGQAINHYIKSVPSIFGGSADLSHSTMTNIAGDQVFAVDSYSARNVYFGVREHAMGAAGNGMALHGGVKPFVSTFFVFSDYLRPAIRLAALQKLPVIYVFTHDSIAVGEDGPTHEPVEHLAALRTIPGLTVIRPSDANETASAWAYALQQQEGPVALVLSRQNLPIYEATKAAGVDGVAKGAYVLAETNSEPEVILIGTGSEVSLAVSAKEELESENISVRVVAMPSRELFNRQSAAYKEAVLPSSVTKRLTLEAGISLGWEYYAGPSGKVLSIDTFGASGSGPEVMESFGFSTSNVVQLVKSLL